MLIMIIEMIIAISFLLMFVIKLRKDLPNWKDVPGFKEEESRSLTIPYWSNLEKIRYIEISWLENHIWYNLYCKIKYEIKRKYGRI